MQDARLGKGGRMRPAASAPSTPGCRAALAMLPVVYAAAWTWHRVKSRAPHLASATLLFLGTAFVYELLTRPW